MASVEGYSDRRLKTGFGIWGETRDCGECFLFWARLVSTNIGGGNLILIFTTGSPVNFFHLKSRAVWKIEQLINRNPSNYIFLTYQKAQVRL